VDDTVWKREAWRLASIPDSMVVVANQRMFGGGVYSTAHARKARMIGRSERRIAGISVEPVSCRGRNKDGSIRWAESPARMPKRLSDPFHPGANSLCFAVQLAHLMGCNPIVAVGFTLQNGLSYFFGRNNPVTGTTTVYETKRALAWLRWYGEQWPGRLQLDPSFDGPVYEVAPRISADGLQALALPRPRASDVGGHQPDPPGGPTPQVEPVRHPG
jgi:hypothetical protein